MFDTGLACQVSGSDSDFRAECHMTVCSQSSQGHDGHARGHICPRAHVHPAAFRAHRLRCGWHVRSLSIRAQCWRPLAFTKRPLKVKCTFLRFTYICISLDILCLYNAQKKLPLMEPLLSTSVHNFF